MNKRTRGFTLIALMVVVLIIAILGALGIVSYVNAVKSARDGKRKADTEAVKQALVLYRTENGCYPTVTSVLSPTYIATLPVDPQSPTRDYGYTPGAGTVICENGSTGRTSFTLTYWSEVAGAIQSVTNP